VSVSGTACCSKVRCCLLHRCCCCCCFMLLWVAGEHSLQLQLNERVVSVSGTVCCGCLDVGIFSSTAAAAAAVRLLASTTCSCSPTSVWCLSAGTACCAACANIVSSLPPLLLLSGCWRAQPAAAAQRARGVGQLHCMLCCCYQHGIFFIPLPLLLLLLL
jgi:hypothetical protein